MKLFQHLLVATASIGFIAPIAAQASELNIEGINSYVRKNSSSKKINYLIAIHLIMS